MEIDEAPAPPPVLSQPEIVDAAIAKVLEIIPDVQPDYLRMICDKYYPEYQQRVHEAVLHALFEDPKYPKVPSGLSLFWKLNMANLSLGTTGGPEETEENPRAS